MTSFWKKYTQGPSTCHRVTISSSNHKTGYNASLNLQNQCKLAPKSVLSQVLSHMAADSAWDPRGPHASATSSLPSPPLFLSPLFSHIHGCTGGGRRAQAAWGGAARGRQAAGGGGWAAVHELLAGRTLDRLRHVGREEVARLVGSLSRSAANGEHVNADAALMGLTSDIVSRMVNW